MFLGVELLKNHWFCKVSGGLGGGNVENPLVFEGFWVPAPENVCRFLQIFADFCRFLQSFAKFCKVLQE